MEFGISFFPNVGPHEKSAARYWDEVLQLLALCEVNTKLLDVEKAKASMRLFAERVMPHFKAAATGC